MQPRTFDFLILAVGVATVSTAAPLIRETDAPATVIAAFRVALASVPLLAVASAKRDLPIQDRRFLLLGLAAGVFIALHFSFWIASVQETSIATSVALVASQPVFVALLSGPVLKERPAPAIWFGIALATFGGLVMVADDLNKGGDTLIGDLFAVLGAIFAAGYILTGRVAGMRGIAWQPYVTVAYSTAAILLVLGAVVNGDSFSGYTNHTYVLLLLLALGPQLIGHTALNRSLGHLPAVTVAIAILGEPVGSSILAAIFLDENPTLLQAVGGFILLAGVYLSIRVSVKSPEQVGVDLDG